MHWKREKIRLPFRLGTKTFAESAIVGINCYQHISSLSPQSALAAPTRVLQQYDVSIARYPSCPVPEELPEIRLVGRYCRYVIHHFPHYITDVTGNFDDYFNQTFSRNSKKKIRKIQLQWEAHNDISVCWQEYRAEQIEKVFLPAARKISRNTMQHKLLDRGLVEGGRRESIVLEQAKEDRSRGYLLFHNEAPVAFNYGAVTASGILELEYGGFEPEYRPWSVGTLLDHLVIQHLFSDPEIQTLDFGEGEGEYKKRFSTKQYSAASIIFFRLTAKNIAVIGAYYLVTKTSQGLVALLAKLKLLDLAKRLVRS